MTAQNSAGRPVLRPAAADDAPAVQAVARAAYSLYLSRMDRPPGPMLADYAGLIAAERVTVAELPEVGVAGFLVLIPEGDCMLLDNIAVAPESQGRGVAGALLRHAEAAARAAGCSAIRLYTNEAMTENQSLYPHLGYQETHRGEEDGYRRVYYRKAL